MEKIKDLNQFFFTYSFMSAPNALPCPVYVRYFLQNLKGKTIGDHSSSLTHLYKEKIHKNIQKDDDVQLQQSFLNLCTHTI